MLNPLEPQPSKHLALATAIEAMMRKRTPEQASVYLASLIDHIPDEIAGYIRIAVDFAISISDEPVDIEPLV